MNPGVYGSKLYKIHLYGEWTLDQVLCKVRILYTNVKFYICQILDILSQKHSKFLLKILKKHASYDILILQYAGNNKVMNIFFMKEIGSVSFKKVTFKSQMSTAFMKSKCIKLKNKVKKGLFPPPMRRINTT